MNSVASNKLIPLSDQSLGFILYTELCRAITPDVTYAELHAHWNREDSANRAAMDRAAKIVGEEAVKRKMN